MTTKKQSKTLRNKTPGKARGRKIARGSARKPAGRRPKAKDWADLGKMYRPIKEPVTLRLDADVVAWFKRQGPGYQTRINRALRQMMMKER